MTSLQRIGILTSGGDAPGMNAAIRAATLIARAAGQPAEGPQPARPRARGRAGAFDQIEDALLL